MKQLAVLIMFVFAALWANAQNAMFKPGERGFVSLNAGPSFPLGDYASNDLNKEHPGFAQTGYNITLQTGYFLVPRFGITASALYTRHGFDNSVFGASASGDHWKYVGVLVGIITSQPVADKAAIDLSLQTGFIRVNSPKVSYNGQDIFTEDWSTTVPVHGQLDIRFKLRKNVQVLAGVNYLYMKPKFTVKADGSTMDVKQKMNVLGLNAGLGFGF